MSNKKLPTCPDFNKLDLLEKKDSIKNHLKEQSAIYIINFENFDVHYKNDDLKNVQKKLKCLSNRHQKEHNTNKTPFIILKYENYDILSPKNLDKKKKHLILSKINLFEKKIDDSLGDFASAFDFIFKKTK
jgi:hypothetical protein